MKFIFQILIIIVLVSVLMLNPFVIGLMYAGVAFIGFMTYSRGRDRYLIVGLMSLVGVFFINEILCLFADWFVLPFSCLLTFAVCKHNLFSFRKSKNEDNHLRDKTKASNRSSSDNHFGDDTGAPHYQKHLVSETPEEIIDVEVISEKTLHHE